VDGEVKAADIDANAVDSARVRDNTINTFDVHSFLGVDVVHDTLTGADVNESSLDGLDAIDGYDASCDPEAETFLDCDASATVTLGRPMNVLVTAMTHFAGLATSPPDGGHCRLERNDAAVSNEHLIGGNLDDTGLPAQAGMQVTDVESLAAGTYTFEVSCNEVVGDIEFRDVRVSVVELAMD
jgi:hypothetical protein